MTFFDLLWFFSKRTNLSVVYIQQMCLCKLLHLLFGIWISDLTISSMLRALVSWGRQLLLFCTSATTTTYTTCMCFIKPVWNWTFRSCHRNILTYLKFWLWLSSSVISLVSIKMSKKTCLIVWRTDFVLTFSCYSHSNIGNFTF